MKATVYFERALRDSAFRQAQIKEQRYYRRISVGMLCLSIPLAAVGVVAGTEGHHWAPVAALLLMASAAVNYTHRATVLAALKAMDDRSPDRA